MKEILFPFKSKRGLITEYTFVLCATQEEINTLDFNAYSE